MINLVFLILPLVFANDFDVENKLRTWIRDSYPVLEKPLADVPLELGPHQVYGWKSSQVITDGLPQPVKMAYQRFAQGVTSADQFKQELLQAWQSFWQQPFRQKTVVAVLDTGLDVKHPLIRENIWRNEPECASWQKFIQCIQEKSLEDCASNELTPANDHNGNQMPLDCHGWAFTDGFYNGRWGHPDVRDQQGHGTHVAGIIKLINPWVTVLPIKVLTQNPRQPAKPYSLGLTTTMPNVHNPPPRSLADFVALGLEYGWQQGARIFHLSLGWPESLSTPFFEATVKKIISQGGIIVAAAGNDQTYQTPHPCSIQGVVCVGALRPDGSLAHFSNWGPTVTVYHFGVAISSLWPIDFWQSNPTAPGWGLRRLSGTSQAAPLVTGLISLAQSFGINLSRFWQYHQPVLDPQPVWSFNSGQPEPLPQHPTQSTTLNTTQPRRLALGASLSQIPLNVNSVKKVTWSWSNQEVTLEGLPKHWKVTNCQLKSHHPQVSGLVQCWLVEPGRLKLRWGYLNKRLLDLFQILEIITPSEKHEILVEIRHYWAESIEPKKKISIPGFEGRIYFFQIFPTNKDFLKVGFLWWDEHHQKARLGLWTDQNFESWDWPFENFTPSDWDDLVEAVWFFPSGSTTGVVSIISQTDQGLKRWDWWVNTAHKRFDQVSAFLGYPRFWLAPPAVTEWPIFLSVQPAALSEPAPSPWDEWNPEKAPHWPQVTNLAWRWGKTLEFWPLNYRWNPWFWVLEPQGPVLWASYQDHRTQKLCRWKWDDLENRNLGCSEPAWASLALQRQAPVWIEGQNWSTVLGYFFAFPNRLLSGLYADTHVGQLKPWRLDGNDLWDSPLTVQAGLIQSNQHQLWMGLTNYKVYGLTVTAGGRKTLVMRNAERFSFIPLSLFVGVHFPMEWNQRLLLYTPEVGLNQNGVKWISLEGVNGTEDVLVAPAAWHLTVLQPCRLVHFPIQGSHHLWMPVSCPDELYLWKID